VRRVARARLAAAGLVSAALVSAARADVAVQVFLLPSDGGFPHDVAVDADGIAWHTAQRSGQLGRLDPATGKVELVPLGRGSSPHGVIIGPDGAPWVTDSGTNVRQILGRPGEVWVPESGADRLVVYRTK